MKEIIKEIKCIQNCSEEGPLPLFLFPLTKNKKYKAKIIWDKDIKIDGYVMLTNDRGERGDCYSTKYFEII